MAGPSGSTGKLALPYPLGTDTVDVPRDLNALATKLDPLVATQTDLNGKSNVPALVSALPGSPTDGQEIAFIADAANGVIWHLRYRAASGSAYKWEYIGGAPLENSVDADEQFAGGAWVTLASGPKLTLPLAGDYTYESTVNIYCNVANDLFHGLGLGVAPVVPHYTLNNSPTPTGSQTVALLQKLKAMAANAAIAQWAYVPTGVGHVRYRRLAATPVRVG